MTPRARRSRRVTGKLGVSPKTISRLLHEGELKAHHWRIFEAQPPDPLPVTPKREVPPLRSTPVRYLWETRRCWICGRHGACEDREPEVDLATVRAELRAELRALVLAIAKEKG